MTNQNNELDFLDIASEHNKLLGMGTGDLADACYICGISPSKLKEYIVAIQALYAPKPVENGELHQHCRLCVTTNVKHCCECKALLTEATPEEDK